MVEYKLYLHKSNILHFIPQVLRIWNLQVMVSFIYQLFLEDLGYLVESEEVPMLRIDDTVEWILRVKFTVGLFEYPSLLDIVGCKVHLQIDMFIR